MFLLSPRETVLCSFWAGDVTLSQADKGVVLIFAMTACPRHEIFFESHADQDAVLISAMTAGPRQEMRRCSQQTRQHQTSNSRLRKASQRIPLAHLAKSRRC